MSELIRILVVDDHAILREGLRALIAGKPDMQLVGEAANGLDGVAKARALAPDVILMDLMMPGLNGIEATREIMQNDPKARVLVLTSFGDDSQVFSAIKAGALGYLLKDSSPHDLIEAIRCVHRGESSLHPAVARKLILQYGREQPAEPEAGLLTERELDVLRLVARGLSNQKIAERLFIGEGTVRFHVSNILSKLQLESRTQAVLYALRKGLATLHDG